VKDKKKRYRELESFKGTHLNESYKKLTFDIIIVRPETAGNIGSIARVMKNFKFTTLVVFNPSIEKSEILSYDTQGFAMHGKDILLNSNIIELSEQEKHDSEFKKFLEKYDLVIGTTAKGKRYSNIKRLSIFPSQLELPLSKKALRIALLFGKESRGLTNEEVALCDLLLRIPTSEEYPTMNLSHSCAIILYEFYRKLYNLNLGRGKNPVLLADKEDRKFVYKVIESIIHILKIRDYKKSNVFHAFKNVFERALMSKKELSLITGVFTKVNSILNDLDLYIESKKRLTSHRD